jgi:DNA-binding MurR/RpiR family transcriptional regulator
MTDTTRTTIAETIRRTLPRMTPTERKPAYTLLANYPIAGLETVAQFAARAGVSSPTILRFIGKLDFDSYSAFQRVLREELMDRQKSPLNKMPERFSATEPGDDLLNRFSRTICDNIRRSFKNISRAEFQAVVELLATPRRPVYLLGGRLGDMAARYLYLHLRMLRPRVRHIANQPTLWPEFLLDMGKQDILLVFDIRRYQEDIIRFAKNAARQRVTIVLFTDQWLSPIANVAKHVFPLHIEVPSNWDSATATIALAEALVADLSSRHWPEIRGRIEKWEQMRQPDRDDD